VKRALKIILALILAVSCVLVTGCSCFPVSEKKGFFTDAVLRSNGIEGIQPPNYMYLSKNVIMQEIYVKIEYTAFEEYAEYVYGFLKERYTYLGFCGVVHDRMFGGSGSFIHCSNQLSLFKDANENTITYTFLFYPNDEIGRVNYTNLHVTLVYYLKERSWMQSNFVMGLRKLGATTEYYYNDEYLEVDNFAIQYVLDPYKAQITEYNDGRKFAFAINQYYQSSENNIGAGTCVKEFIDEHRETFGVSKSSAVSAVLRYEPEFYNENVLYIAYTPIAAGKNARVIFCWIDDAVRYGTEINDGRGLYVKFEYYDDASITEPMNLYALVEFPKSYI